MIGDDLERVENLVEHLPVLAGDAHTCIKQVRFAPKLAHDRTQFDRFGTSAEDEEGLNGNSGDDCGGVCFTTCDDR